MAARNIDKRVFMTSGNGRHRSDNVIAFWWQFVDISARRVYDNDADKYHEQG
jgi:hypothetical protein